MVLQQAASARQRQACMSSFHLSAPQARGPAEHSSGDRVSMMICSQRFCDVASVYDPLS